MALYGTWPVGDIDHIDGDSSNNKFDNLRDTTRSENLYNRGDWRPNSRGTSFDKATGLWRSRINKDGKTINLGRFPTEQQAHDAYVSAAKRLHGEFYRIAPVKPLIAAAPKRILKSVPPIKATGFTVEELRQHLRYGAETGDFWWLVSGGNRCTDQPAGTVRDSCKEP